MFIRLCVIEKRGGKHPIMVILGALKQKQKRDCLNIFFQKFYLWAFTLGNTAIFFIWSYDGAYVEKFSIEKMKV